MRTPGVAYAGSLESVPKVNRSDLLHGCETGNLECMFGHMRGGPKM